MSRWPATWYRCSTRTRTAAKLACNVTVPCTEHEFVYCLRTAVSVLVGPSVLLFSIVSMSMRVPLYYWAYKMMMMMMT